MAQSLKDKKDALRTILPLVHHHLHLIDSVRSALGCLPSKGYIPPSRPVGPDADEGWIRAREWMQKRYRTKEVLEELKRMATDPQQFRGQIMAQHVYWTYIEPWPEFAANARYVEKGLEILARRISGELVPYSPMPATQEKPREARRRQVAEMLRAGFTRRRIVDEVGCSEHFVTKVRQEEVVRP